MKTITIPYEEYLEMEKCYKAIEEIKERLKYGAGTEFLREPINKMVHIKITDCYEIFKLIPKQEPETITKLEIYRG